MTQEERRKRIVNNRTRGCLIGGAAGDALGYTVEFWSRSEILSRYGSDGITAYDLTGGKALISDDTQMTLFTANALIYAVTGGCLRGEMIVYDETLHSAYLDWLHTQSCGAEPPRISWLLDVKELYSRRAPGNTCLSALMSGRMGTPAKPINHSKGCGGVMRAAPAGLIRHLGCSGAFYCGCAAAAVTHGHPLGWLPAGVLGYIVHRVALNDLDLRTAIDGSLIYMEESYPSDESRQLAELVRTAVRLTENDASDAENVACLGEGWVGDEALAIAIYAAVKYEHDFDRALICAVNHSGDSDSTGAIAGNIVGAVVGYDAIADKWKDDLELHDVILEMADDLALVIPEQISERFGVKDDWVEKYVNSRRARG